MWKRLVLKTENGRKKEIDIAVMRYKPLTLPEYKWHISGLKNNSFFYSMKRIVVSEFSQCFQMTYAVLALKEEKMYDFTKDLVKRIRFTCNTRSLDFPPTPIAK